MNKHQTTTLVIGGTGVSGIKLVEGLLERSYDITVLHSGRHKPDSKQAPWYHDGSVKVLLGNPFNEKKFREALGREDFYYDVVFSNYGNLRMIAKVFAQEKNGQAHCGRFISVGGQPIYSLYGDAADKQKAINGRLICPYEESGPICTEDGTLSSLPKSHNPKLDMMVLAEQAVFKYQPTATHVRYPLMYGPYQLIPTEWLVVRRILDKRKFIIVPSDGETVISRCSNINGANMLLYCLDCPEGSKGEIFNASDEQLLTLSQWIQIIANALNSHIQIVPMPREIAVPAKPLRNEMTAFGSLKKAYKNLDYSDKISAVDALSETARWLVKNPPGREAELLMHDPFDYENEDLLLKYWQQGDLNACKSITWKREPSYGHFYYGKEFNAFDALSQEERHEGVWDPLAVKRQKMSKL